MDNQEIQEQLKVMLEKIEKIEQSSSNMDRHISFIEKVYATLKAPIDYVVSSYNKLTLKS